MDGIELKQQNAFIFYGLLFFLFLNVFPHVNVIKDTVFYLSLGSFLFLVYKKKVDFSGDSPLRMPFLLFTAWAFITSVFAQDVILSFHSFYSHLIRYLLFYFLLINTFKTKKDLALMAWVVVISSVLFFSGGLIYFYALLGNPLGVRFGFLGFSINIIGLFTIFSILLSIQLISLQKSWFPRVFLGMGILVLVAATMLTQSRGAFISLIISSLIMLGKNKKVYICFLGILMLAGAMLPVKNRISKDGIFNDPLRMCLFYYSLEIIKEYPVMGVGFSIDTFKNKNLMDQEKYKKNTPVEYKNKIQFRLPHSMPLSLLVRTGIIGFSMFLIILACMYKMSITIMLRAKDVNTRNWARCFTAALTMFIVSGLFEPVFIHSLDTLFYTIAALMTILWKIERQLKPPQYKL